MMAKAKTSANPTAETFQCCGQFQEALDPNIKKAYLGYCRGLEWPFTVMVPIGGLGGDCPNPGKKETKVEK
jgi:hypothetical protein